LNRKRPKRFFFRKEKKGFVIYDILNSEIFFINNTAKEILILIDEGLSKENVIKQISKKYNLPKKGIIKGVNKLWKEIK